MSIPLEKMGWTSAGFQENVICWCNIFTLVFKFLSMWTLSWSGIWFGCPSIPSLTWIRRNGQRQRYINICCLGYSRCHCRTSVIFPDKWSLCWSTLSSYCINWTSWRIIFCKSLFWCTSYTLCPFFILKNVQSSLSLEPTLQKCRLWG